MTVSTRRSPASVRRPWSLFRIAGLTCLRPGHKSVLRGTIADFGEKKGLGIRQVTFRFCAAIRASAYRSHWK